jgi:hypothetical protein
MQYEGSSLIYAWLERLSTSSYPVNRKTAGFSETLLSVDEIALRHVPEECILHFLISLKGF